MSGKDVRLKQLFKYSRRLFVLPMDHGATIGPVQGLDDIHPVVNAVKEKVDAVLVHKGMVRQIVDCLGAGGCGLIVHLSASTSLAPDPNRKELVATVEQALRMGATAVSVHVNLGSPSEAAMLKDLGSVAEQCEVWGMPLLAMIYVRDGNKQSEYDSDRIKLAARVAEELGADIVKVNYSGSIDSFSEVVGGVKIPVIIAGGPKISSDCDLLNMVYNSVKAGARGVAIGRNLFQNSNPGLMAAAIRQILDGNMTQQDFMELEKKFKPQV